MGCGNDHNDQFHEECLTKLCRLCSSRLQTVSQKNAKKGRIYCVENYSGVILSNFGIDVTKDVPKKVHPPSFCNSCRTAMNNFKRNPNSHANEMKRQDVRDIICRWMTSQVDQEWPLVSHFLLLFSHCSVWKYWRVLHVHLINTFFRLTYTSFATFRGSSIVVWKGVKGVYTAMVKDSFRKWDRVDTVCALLVDLGSHWKFEKSMSPGNEYAFHCNSVVSLNFKASIMIYMIVSHQLKGNVCKQKTGRRNIYKELGVTHTIK